MVSIYVEFFDGFWDIQLVNGYRGYPFWKILNYLKVVYPKDLVIITNHNYSPPLERYAKYIETFCSDFLTGIIEVDKVIE